MTTKVWHTMDERPEKDCKGVIIKSGDDPYSFYSICEFREGKSWCFDGDDDPETPRLRSHMRAWAYIPEE